MKLLNLGCGSTFHKDWVNIDFISNSEYVKSHNLLLGVPFETNSMDVVYHSHVLEHFSKSDGIQFIKECYRVLNNNGIIRIAVPDLETIIKEYLRNLELAAAGQAEAKYNYNWIVLELFDQMVRNESGGEMKGYLYAPEVPNESYVFSRIGVEFKNIRDSYMRNRQTKKKSLHKSESILKTVKKSMKRLIYTLKSSRKNRYLTGNQKKALEIGQFRLGGEIHQWMYDRYSLSELLKAVGFENIKICTAFESSVQDWDTYQLDVVDGEVRKPDSLFIEARKE